MNDTVGLFHPKVSIILIVAEKQNSILITYLFNAKLFFINLLKIYN